jgi:hypothetical protein
MWHATCTQVNQGDSWLLMVGSQIDSLTPSLSFGHNLCFKCPNGSCENILDIYVVKKIQWDKELFNPISFDPCDCPLNIQESIEIPILKVGAHLGVWGFILSNSPTLMKSWNVIPELHSWCAPLQALALVVNPRLGFWHSWQVWHMHLLFLRWFVTLPCLHNPHNVIVMKWVKEEDVGA